MRFLWCSICLKHHPSHATRTRHVAPEYVEPKTFEEYEKIRFEGLSDEAQQDFLGNSKKYEMFRALWMIQWLENRGEYTLANEERMEMLAVVRTSFPSEIREAVSV